MKERYAARRSLHGYFFWTLAFILLPGIGFAEIVRQTIEHGLVATADYLEGKEDLPAILILHGFLQTREFSTVRRLADALHDDGYTLLLPNLTLGISARREVLSCEAVHTHSMQQDTEELARWIDWLARKTAKKIVLIGHSAGNLPTLAYLNSQRHPPSVVRAILISLYPFGPSPMNLETAADKLRARHELQADPGRLREYGLVYCRHYPTTPERYLSYVYWNQDTTLEAIRWIDLPMSVILGGADRRIDAGWRASLKKSHLRLIEIAEANHFFSNQYEFDLLNTIESELDRLQD